MVNESIGSLSRSYLLGIISGYGLNQISLQTAKTESKVLGVENLSSSSEVIVRFIRREGRPYIFRRELIKPTNKEG